MKNVNSGRIRTSWKLSLKINQRMKPNNNSKSQSLQRDKNKSVIKKIRKRTKKNRILVLETMHRQQSLQS